MHAIISAGCDTVRTPSIVLRHNIEPVQYGRTVQVVARMNEGVVVGVKQINCWKDGDGQATTIKSGVKPMLDAAFKVALDELEQIDKRKSSDDARERDRVGETFLACLTSEGNDWPAGAAKLMSECAS